MRHMDQIDPIAELRAACAVAGSQARWAAANGVSRQYVHDVLTGLRTPGPAILSALGIVVVSEFRRVPPDA